MIGIRGNPFWTDVNDYCIAIFVRKKEMVRESLSFVANVLNIF